MRVKTRINKCIREVKLIAQYIFNIPRNRVTEASHKIRKIYKNSQKPEMRNCHLHLALLALLGIAHITSATPAGEKVTANFYFIMLLLCIKLAIYPVSRLLC